jgi:hypothetical protein
VDARQNIWNEHYYVDETTLPPCSCNTVITPMRLTKKLMDRPRINFIIISEFKTEHRFGNPGQRVFFQNAALAATGLTRIQCPAQREPHVDEDN